MTEQEVDIAYWLEQIMVNSLLNFLDQKFGIILMNQKLSSF